LQIIAHVCAIGVTDNLVIVRLDDHVDLGHGQRATISVPQCLIIRKQPLGKDVSKFSSQPLDESR
jgi:hypothetical protein